MKHFFYAISKAMRFVPLQSLIRATGQSVIMPFYHTVSDTRLPHIAHLYPVRTAKQFAKDLDFYLSQYTPIGLREIVACLNTGTPLPHRSFFLSFDDGLREFKEIVAPIVKQKGVPATCFVNSAFVGNTALFFRFKASILAEQIATGHTDSSKIEQLLKAHGYHGTAHSSLLSIPYQNKHILDEIAETIGVDFGSYLQEQQPYLNAEEIQTLHAEGFEFGAHSTDHPLYCNLPLAEQLQQTAESVAFLTNVLGEQCTSFSFPFTDDGVAPEFFDHIFAKNNPVVSASFAGAGLKTDPIKRHFQRIPIEQNSHPASDSIVGEYLYFMFKALFNKNTITR